MDVSEDTDSMKSYYEEELKKRDKIVDQLRRENLEILENALRQTEENLRLKEELDSLRGKEQ